MPLPDSAVWVMPLARRRSRMRVPMVLMGTHRRSLYRSVRTVSPKCPFWAIMESALAADGDVAGDLAAGGAGGARGAHADGEDGDDSGDGETLDNAHF